MPKYAFYVSFETGGDYYNDLYVEFDLPDRNDSTVLEAIEAHLDQRCDESFEVLGWFETDVNDETE